MMLHYTSSPHLRDKVTTTSLMLRVVLALLPALVAGIALQGLRALLVTLVSVAACVFFEWGWCKVTKMHCKVYDMSAMVTGVLIAFVCPVSIPFR